MSIKTVAHFMTALAVLFFLMGAIMPLVAALLLAKPFLSRKRYNRFAEKVQNNYLLVFTWCIEAPYKRNVYFYGDTVPDHESALVVPNHAASHGDWAPLYSLAARSKGLGSVKTVSKQILMFIPFFGIAMYLMQWPFLARKWTSDKAYLHKKLSTYRDSGLPMLLWLFAEGTRWTPKKHKKAVEFAKSRNQYEPTHTLVPKPTGFMALVRGLDGIVTHIHDVTIAYTGYPQSKNSKGPGFSQIFSPITKTKEECAFHVHVRRIPMSEVPCENDTDLKKFLFDMYEHKDQLLKEFHANGTFDGQRGKDIPLDPRAKFQLVRHALMMAVVIVAPYIALF